MGLPYSLTVLSYRLHRYFYDGYIHVIPDIDGCRIISNDVCEFLQRVPDPVEDVFRLGSTSPASVLLDAVDQFENKSPKADDDLQLIRSNLAEAVDTCVKAAGHEFSIHWQKQLLKAASFGKSVLDLYNSDDFVDMCETLRVLNAVRFYEIGLPISYVQFVRLTPEKLVRRLVNRQEYLLALRVSEYLRLPTDGIYIRWACQKVRVSTEDEDSICRAIVKKMNGKRGISFEEIARAAYDEGRGRLATELLNYEPRAGKQVPLLLQMEEDQIALDKAIESGDTDLIFSVLLHLRKKLPLAAFFRAINNRPVAVALVESSARSQDEDLLKDLYYQDDRRLDSANLYLRGSLRQKDLQSTIDKLKIGQKILQDSKEYGLEHKAFEEAARLLKLQDGLSRDISERFVGLSVNQTIFNLTRLGYSSRAKKVQSEFKVQEKTYWWLRLRALVAKRDWGELEEMAKNRRSPIGWEVRLHSRSKSLYPCPISFPVQPKTPSTRVLSEPSSPQATPTLTSHQPFFTEILSAGNPKLAASFIPKCTNLSVAERIEMWVKCGILIKAGEEAFRAKDGASLEMLRAKVSGQTLTEIERMIARLKVGR